MDLPPTSPESNPTPDSGRNRSSRMAAGMLGAVVGMGALVGTMAVVAGAGAQSSSAPAEDPEPVGVVSVADDAVADDLILDDAEFEAFFVCVDEAFAAAMSAEDGDTELSEAELDALYDAAEEQAEACESELPEGVDFDVIEEGFEDEFDDIDDLDDIEIPEVVVETADGLELIDFGEGDATITITKSGDEITVAVDGDATAESLDWAAIDEWDEAEEIEEGDDMDEEDDDEDDADDEMDGDADDVEEEDAETTN